MAVYRCEFSKADGRTGVAIVVAGTEVAAQMMLVQDRRDAGDAVVVGEIVDLCDADPGVEVVSEDAEESES
jgi:hypothetical protein